MQGRYICPLFVSHCKVLYKTRQHHSTPTEPLVGDIVQMGKYSGIFKEHWLIRFTVDVDTVLVHYVDASSATMWMLVQPACGSF